MEIVPSVPRRQSDFRTDENELLERMDKVFTKLAGADLKIKSKKCRLFCRDT